MIFSLLLILFGLLAYHIYLHYSKFGRIINKIPGPMPLPLIGNMIIGLCSAEELWKRSRFILNLYYPIVKFWYPTFPLVVIRHPDDVKILTSCKINIEKSNLVYENFRFAGGDGLITSGGDKWHYRRKMLTPGFGTNVLKSYIGVANDHVQTFIEYIKSQGDQSTQELHSLCMKLTMGIICEAAMGFEVINKLGAEYEKHCRYAVDIFFETSYSRFKIPYIKNWMMKILPMGRRQEQALKKAHEASLKVIKDRQDYHDSTGHEAFKSYIDEINDSSDIKRFSGRKNLAVLDILLLAQKEGLIDDKGLKEEVDTFIIAGYETVGTSIFFTLLVLADNKKAQDLARAEVINILGANEDKVTAVELQKMEYLDRCIKEVLRLYPSAPYIGRCIKEDIQLKNYILPAKTEVMIDIYNLHRDPNFWPEPDKFDPDRFLPENTQNRHSHAFMPFSAGLRNCIGQKFAMQELKLIIAQVLYNFYLEPIDRIVDIKMKMDITLRTAHPTYVKFVKINNNL